jgi:hypothetical protein
MRKEADRHVKNYKAFTLVEVILVVGTLALVAGTLVGLIINSYEDFKLGSSRSTLLQDGQSAIGQMVRILRQVTAFSAVSESTDQAGYITFTNIDGTIEEFRLNTGTSELEYGEPGSLSALTGSVTSLFLTCYDIDGNALTGPISAGDIQSVQIEMTLNDGENSFTLSGRVCCPTDLSSLIAWWKLDETSGLTATDSSGNNNHGTLRNMAGDEWTSGAVGGALNFDGNNDYVAIQNLHYDGSDYPEVSVTAWVRTSDGGDQIIISFDRNEYWRLEINGNGGGTGQIGWDVRTSSGQVDYGSTTRVDDGDWHHIAGVFDNGTLIIYIDGNSESPDSGGSTFGKGKTRYGFLVVGSEATSFDGNKGPTNYFNGDMDDVRIYNRALSAQEISQLASILRYLEFTEAKTGSNVTSITIPTPTTNEGDLLIAAVATDGGTSSSLAPPGGEGWTEIDIGDYSGEVTLGAWWKLADASESTSHQFTWSGGQHAYGWIMCFTGHDPSDPINDHSTSGESSSTPTSPAVTTTVSDCIILRLGAFDDDDITVDDPGLSGHTSITMDKTAAAAFQDGFETSFDLWTDGGTTDWDRTLWQHHSGSYSAHAGWFNTDLTSDNIDTSSCGSFTIDFWYMDDDLDDNDDVYLQLYNGGSYIDRFLLNLPSSEEDDWHNHNETVYDSGGDSQYFRNNFRIRFEATDINNWRENIWIDDVTVTVSSSGLVSGGAGYVKQSAIGSSGTSTFTLGSSNQARTLTIAIAPAP